MKLTSSVLVIPRKHTETLVLLRVFRKSIYRWKMAPDPWCPCGSGEAQTAEHITSGLCDSFRMPGANADLASPPPALCAWLEDDLAV